MDLCCTYGFFVGVHGCFILQSMFLQLNLNTCVTVCQLRFSNWCSESLCHLKCHLAQATVGENEGQ